MALSRYTGIPRTHARTMREILPAALPGKRLEDCTPAELVQLGIRRYAERILHEASLPEGFISDGSSLHEWVYGMIRGEVGIDPANPRDPDRELTQQERAFREVMENFGAVVQDHAVQAYDVFIHLPIEFPLSPDGHRPVSERFRHRSDEFLLATLAALGIPVHIAGGTLQERLDRITGVLALRPVMSLDQAITLARADMAALETADELVRGEQPA